MITLNFLIKIPSFLSITLISAYRTIGTQHLGGCCRFEPSCSEYSLLCYQRFSFIKATKLTIVRIFSCRPGGTFGFDPVPERKGS